MSDSVPSPAELRAVDAPPARATLFARVVEPGARFAKSHEISILLIVAALGLSAYALLGPAPLPSRLAAEPKPAPAAGAPAGATPVFRVRTFVSARGRTQQRDARVALTDEAIVVSAVEGSRQALHTVANERVRSIAYSHGPDPVWNSPSGPTKAARTGGVLRKFGVGVDRHWIVIAGDEPGRLVILRVEDNLVQPLLAALEERTGQRPEVIASRK